MPTIHGGRPGPASIVIVALASLLVYQLARRVVEWGNEWHDTSSPARRGELIANVTLQPVAPLTAAASLVGGRGPCRVVIFVTGCPAATATIVEFGADEELNISGRVLPVMWVAQADDKGTVSLLVQNGVKTAYSIAAEDWKRLGVEYSPEFFVVSAGGHLITSGYPRREYMEHIPPELLWRFDEQCDVLHAGSVAR